MSELEKWKAYSARLRTGLQNVFDLIEEELLVRNIDDDSDPMWVLKWITPMNKLAFARQMLDENPPGEGPCSPSERS